MNKLLIFLLLIVLFLAGCNTANGPVACTEDAKLCPDGSAVGRIPPNCDFAECPSEEPKNGCDYTSEVKKYVGKSQDECSRIRFVCEPSREYFEDECGCGCELKEGKNDIAENYCTPEQKKADVCIELYKPVCGWFDPKTIQCIKYPCAAAYSNSCFACADEKVLYWTEGECPE